MTDEKRLITIEDVMNIRYVEDPQISPDGKWIAYVVMNADKMERGYKRDIYMVSSEGSKPIRLSRSGKATSPRWSPDSANLAFVSVQKDSNGGAKPHIYILPISQPGEARQLTSNENGAFAPAWSPDGESIAYLSRMNSDERSKEDSDEKGEAPQDKLDGKHRSERKAEDEKNRFDPRPMERIPYRQGTSFMDDRHTQIYIIPTADGLEGDDAKPRRMTNRNAGYTPPVWSKSGRHLITTRAWDTKADEYFLWSNLYLIGVESGIERRIKDNENTYGNPIPSYNGDWIVCSRSPSGATDALTHLTLVPLEGSGEPVELNVELDRSIAAYDWTEDGKLLVIVETDGRSEVHSLDPKTKAYSPIITDEQSIYGFSMLKNGNFAFVSRTTNRIDELFFKADGETQQMTEVNQSFMDEIEVQETHEIRFQNGNGDEIQGWYILPPNFEDGKQYPLALNIHGGPHVMWSPSARSIWHEWQVHAAAGYVVFFCNPRGSDGYGQNHLSAIRSNWGSITMDDVMAGVDTMIAKGFVDESKMAVTGGSFGGYMTGWIVGNSDRFASAVSQRGVYNISSFYGTSDVPILMSAEFEAEPWEAPEKFWEHSPLAYAHNVTTPTLIIHSENDYRVPIEQAEQFFAWIRRASDTPVKMLRYPREGHELSRSGEPQHRISRLSEMVDWFNKYCKVEN